MIRVLFILVTTFCLAATLTSFKEKQSNLLTAKSIFQNMSKIHDDLYVYKYEVSNLEYRTFLNDMRTKNPLLVKDYEIDSMKWTEGINYGEPMKNYYHIHPTYNNYPVVNISLEGARAYCDWLSDQYNSDPKRKFKKVRFYIPTEDEWMHVANGGDKNKMYPWGNYYLRKKTGEFLCNFKHIGDAFIVSDDQGNPKFNDNVFEKVASNLNDISLYTTNVNSFWPNSFGLYNMSGNVAEMTTEKGLAKGGSWNSYGGEVTIQSKKIYSEPSPEVGFRVFMYVDNIETGELIKPKKGEKPSTNRSY